MEMFRRAARKVIKDIKRARRNLYQQKLVQMGVLAAVQSGQKWFSRSLPAPAPELLQAMSDQAEVALADIIQEGVDELVTLADNAEISIAAMKAMNAESMRKTVRTVARDSGDSEEKEIVQRKRIESLPLEVMMTVRRSLGCMRSSG